MTKFGETHYFKGTDFVRTLEGVIERKVDGIVYNSKKPMPSVLDNYRSQKAVFVEIDRDDPVLGK